MSGKCPNLARGNVKLEQNVTHVHLAVFVDATVVTDVFLRVFIHGCVHALEEAAAGSMVFPVDSFELWGSLQRFPRLHFHHEPVTPHCVTLVVVQFVYLHWMSVAVAGDYTNTYHTKVLLLRSWT